MQMPHPERAARTMVAARVLHVHAGERARAASSPRPALPCQEPRRSPCTFPRIPTHHPTETPPRSVSVLHGVHRGRGELLDIAIAAPTEVHRSSSGDEHDVAGTARCPDAIKEGLVADLAALDRTQRCDDLLARERFRDRP